MDNQGYLPEEPEYLPREHAQIPAHIRGPVNVAVKTLLTWNSEGRPFRKRSKEYFINVLLIMLPVLIVLFLFSQYLLMLVVLALVFVNYALKTIPPESFHYKISNQGVTINEYFFLWKELYDFYFKHYENQEVLILRTKNYFPGELTLTLGEIHKDQVKSVLLSYLPFRESVELGFMEVMGQRLAKLIPLDKSPHEQKV